MTQQSTRFIVQPGQGIKPVIEAILNATRSVRMVIFRCDFDGIETALAAAVQRGVFVHVIVAHQNSDDEACLRDLELRLLACGATVARTDTDLLRYHNKMIIIDEEELLLLSFNYTLKDTHRSRSFGLVTRHRPWVEEAVKLFTADATRQTYTPGNDTFVVSPLNSRESLTRFIEEAQHQLLIYDKRVTDKGIVKLLRQKQAEGVEVRIIGKASPKLPDVEARKLKTLRLHARVIIRDGETAFLGSQSLRAAELDARREVGLLIEDAQVVTVLRNVFEQDWTEADEPKPKVVKSDDSVPRSPAAAALGPEDLKEALKEVLNSALVPGSDDALAGVVKEVVKEVILEALAPDVLVSGAVEGEGDISGTGRAAHRAH